MKSMKKEFSFKDRFENVLMLGSGHVPAFLYCGEKPVLFDPGVSAFGPLYLEKIMQNLKDPSSLILALTHSHFDHLGSVPYMKRQIPKLEFGGSPVVGDILKKESVIKRMNQMSEHQRQSYEEIAGDEDVHIESVALDFSLKEGDKIDLGGITCEIYETPGHTRDSISFFLPEEGILFPGEAVGLPDLENIEKPPLPTTTNLYTQMA